MVFLWFSEGRLADVAAVACADGLGALSTPETRPFETRGFNEIMGPTGGFHSHGGTLW